MRHTSGTPISGASVGILMLDTVFPRIPGDIGNAKTWPFPVHYKIVRNVSPALALSDNAMDTLDQFIAAAKELVADGVDGITTSCGFLSLFQQELAAALPVPVASSSLMQVNLVNAILPKDKVAGILTISKSALTPRHLAAAHVPKDTPIHSTEAGQEFTQAILGGARRLNVDQARQDNIVAAQEMCNANSALGAIVLECTNMAPYAADIKAATGLPVFSMYHFVRWFQSGLEPKAFV